MEFKYKISKREAYNVSLYIFVFSLPFDPDWSSKALILMVICGSLNVNYKKKLFFRSIFLILVAILCIYTILNIAINTLEFKSPLFTLTGLIFLFYLLFTQTHLKVNLRCISLVSLLAVMIVGIINLLNLLYIGDNFGLLTIYNSWEKYSLIDIHKIYYSSYLNMSYLSTFYFLLKSNKKYYLIVTLFISACALHYFTGSIGGIFIFMLINILLACYFLINKYFRVIIKVLLFGPLLIMFLLSSLIFQEYFKKVDGEGSRVRNYNVNKQIFYDAPVFGHGVGIELETMQKYRHVGSWEYIQEYNSHNQYFQFLIGGGLVLLFLFLVPLYLLYKQSLNSKDGFIIQVYLIIILYVFLIESLLERHHGIMFLAFYFSYFAFGLIGNKLNLKSN